MFIVIDKHALIILKHLELPTLKYISNYMLIYVKIIKSSDCLDILYTDT